MKVVFFSSKNYDKQFLVSANESHRHKLQFLEVPLHKNTAILAKGFEGICIFVNDIAQADVVEKLADLGIKLIALRCAGYNNVDFFPKCFNYRAPGFLHQKCHAKYCRNHRPESN